MIRRLHTDERGIAMLMALALITLISIISVTLFTVTEGDKQRSDASAKQNAAYQAAEAGTNAYLSDLTESTAFPNAYLAKGEATRTDTNGVTHASSNSSDVAWSSGSTWTYATPMATDAGWYTIGNGYQYLIKVYPANPNLAQSQAQVVTRIDVTGRPTGSTDASTWRTIETLIRPLSLADFLSFTATSVTYGASATTTGPIFVGENSSGTPGTLTHDGTAKASLYSEGTVTGSTTLQNGARKYDKNSNPTALCKLNACNPIPFSTFQSSITAVSTAAGAGGISLGSTDSSNSALSGQSYAVDAWKLVFNSNGTVSIYSCLHSTWTDSSHNVHSYADYSGTAPSCALSHAVSPNPVAVPANGAIYSAADVLVSGIVKGKVTVATAGDVVFAGNTTYNTNGTDVLGLEAQGGVYVAAWAKPSPSSTPLNLWAAMLALSGPFEADPNYNGNNQNDPGPVSGTMNFYGSIDVYGQSTGAIIFSNMFTTRNYNYDANLLFVQPPLWPTLPASFTILVQREV
ncbi:MAG TPA: hypothetical protein VFA30_09310 [Gaiellaceae bacterium]|nr:hypothetical protein [Gaiellaceae bacterium]